MEKESAEKNHRGNLPNLLITESAATSVYSNFINVSHIAGDFKLFFCQIDQAGNALATNQITVSPMYIKGFVKALQENIDDYEKRFGLELPETEEKFINTGIQKKK